MQDRRCADGAQAFIQGDWNRHQAYTPKDELSTRYNAQGHQKLRPSSAGIRMQDHGLVQSRRDVVSAEKGQQAEQGGTSKRPSSARPASAKGLCAPGPGHDLLERRRPASALGRVREWHGGSSRESHKVRNARPSSAMSRLQEAVSDDIATTIAGDGRGRDDEGNPFGSIVSTGTHEVIEAAASAPGGMTAEEQLKVMEKHEARRTLISIGKKSADHYGGEHTAAKCTQSTGAGSKQLSKFKGLIHLHKKDIQIEIQEKKEHGVEYLQRTLFEYEEKDRERYMLPFADVYLNICAGKNLPKHENQCSPFAVVTLRTSERGQIGAEQKTRVEHSNPNPIWNTHLRFDCRDLERDAVLSFTCWHKSNFTHVKDVALAQCTLKIRDLKLNEHEEWHLPVKPLAKGHDGGMTSTLHVTTFFGKEDAYQVWKDQEAEKRKMEHLKQKYSKDKPASQHPSPAKGNTGGVSSPPARISKQAVPDDSKKNGHTQAFGHDFNDVSVEHSTTMAPTCNGTKAKTSTHTGFEHTRAKTSTHTGFEHDGTGYSNSRLQLIWQSCSKVDWEGIGVGADVFDYLSALQAQERGRMLNQTVDFLLPPPAVGTVHRVCPDPERINLEHVADAPDELLLYMAQYSGSHIKALDMGGCNKLSLSAVRTFVQEFRFISRLSLKGHPSVDDSWLRELSGMHLEDLDISHCVRITDEGLVAAATQFPGLRNLNCSHCCQLTEAGMLALSERCKRLESLFVLGCRALTKHAISSVIARCSLLVHLEVPGIRAIASDMFAPEKRSLRNLRGLNVSNCKGFDDKALQYLTGLDALETLILHANPGITDLGLAAVASFKNLNRLSLVRCSQITDKGLIQIVTNCRRMRRLDLDFCRLISDTGIMFIADFLELLEHLSVRGCTNVTDVGVRCVLKHCPNLCGLDVAHAGADEDEIRLVVNTLHEERKKAQEKEDLEWLYGRKGTGLEVRPLVFVLNCQHAQSCAMEVYCTFDVPSVHINDTQVDTTAATLLPGTQQLDCTFSVPNRGHGRRNATNALAFDAKRDLPSHLLVKHLLAQQDGMVKDSA